jgi:hypothetical protein
MQNINIRTKESDFAHHRLERSAETPNTSLWKKAMRKRDLKFEVLTTVLMKIKIFGEVTLCRLVRTDAQSKCIASISGNNLSSCNFWHQDGGTTFLLNISNAFHVYTSTFAKDLNLYKSNLFTLPYL